MDTSVTVALIGAGATLVAAIVTILPHMLKNREQESATSKPVSSGRPQKVTSPRSAPPPLPPPKSSSTVKKTKEAIVKETTDRSSKRLSIKQRQEIFLALVLVQDRGNMTVDDSLKHIVDEFAISAEQVRQIQDEGIEKEWPPLNNGPLSTNAATR